MRPRRRPILHYLAAAAITGSALALRVLLGPVWGMAAPFVLLYPAVMLSAWIGGLGPGVFATVGAALGAVYFWLEPYREWKIAAPADAALLGLFVLACLGFCILTEALTRARARLDALLDASPVGLGFHDAALRYIRVNSALAEINGRPPQAHIGRTGRELLGADAADVVEPILDEVLRTGRSVHVPVLRVRLDATGAQRWYSVAYAPVRDPAGRVSGVAVSVSDVTETQRAQEALAHERELLQTIIDSIPVMITLYEPSTGELRVNREFERITGWAAAEVSGTDFMAVCFPEPAYRATVRDFINSPQPGWRDLILTTKDRRSLETSWSMVRLSDDSRVGIGLDATDRKRYETEMQAARTVAEAANRAKDEFIAMLGHELRNPLSAISGAVAVLQRVGAHDAQPAASARDVIARQTQHLARLMDDLLDVGRVMTGKIVLDRRPIDLLEAAERVVTTIRATGRAARHRLTVAGTPAWVDGDVTRIEQVITNLVTNALKYTRSEGAISVVVAQDARESMLRVADTGLGIAPELLPRIFELFVQGEQAPERAQGGLGIGLTLVRRLVELHGGRVEAASAGEGKGSVFTIAFPRLPAPAAPAAARRRTVTPQRTLVVEDNDDARDMLRTLLELDGHTVHVAANGIAGLAAALEHRPDVAVVDIGLPEMDGYEVARKLRASGSLKAIKLIALTGYGQADDARRAYQAGFDLHVVKPIDPERLADAMFTVVNGAGTTGLTAPPRTLA